MSRPSRIIIVGMGVRSMIYAREALEHPDLFQIVGVADVNPDRVKVARETFGIPDENCFSSVEALVAVPKFAEGVINGTMDQQHVPTSLPLLRHGYDILLEKPFAVNRQEAEQLIECEHGLPCAQIRAFLPQDQGDRGKGRDRPGHQYPYGGAGELFP